MWKKVLLHTVGTLIAYYSFMDLKHVKLVKIKIVISAYECFRLFSLAFVVVVVCFFYFSNKRDIWNFRVIVVRDIELR